jgi:O-acetyl-ADP-ribose deacetylase (regulator of RNase III)
MKILLRDRNPEMVEAWRREFTAEPDVEISLGDILDLRADAIVSPANSFGWMTGGIDGAYSRRWPNVQKTLRDHLAEHHFGELPVGLAAIVKTDDENIPWLVSAPTMRVPISIRGTVNAYLAFRAALAAVLRHNARLPCWWPHPDMIESILCPGMGTFSGMMDVNIAARQMYAAYKVVIKKDRPLDPGQMFESHSGLLGDVLLLPPPSKTVPAPSFQSPLAAGAITPPPTGKNPAKQVGKAKVEKAKKTVAQVGKRKPDKKKSKKK